MKKKIIALLTALALICCDTSFVYAAEIFSEAEKQAGIIEEDEEIPAVEGNEEGTVTDDGSPGTESPDIEEDAEIQEEQTEEEKAGIVGSGTCGDNMSWNLSQSGILTIWGSGEMYDYQDHQNQPPWKPWEESSYINKTVKSIVIGEGVTGIGKYAFSTCQNLETVSLPTTLKEIRYAAFLSCHSIKEVVLPQGLETIDRSAFEGCKSLREMDIPDSVTSLGDSAFRNCEGLVSLWIGKNLTQSLTGVYFDDCRSLTSIQVSPGNSSYVSEEGILFSRDKTLLVCYPQAKQGQKYTVPDTVKIIGDSAFANCVDLAGLTVSNSVTTIRANAFYGNRNLRTFDFGERTESIGLHALEDCTALETVTFPRKLNYIGNCAFAYDTSLRKIYFKGNAPSIGDNAFRNVNATVFYPANVGSGWTSEIISPNYEGTLTWRHWEVPLTSITGGEASLSNESYFYDGTEKKPTVTVVVNGIALSQGTDYEVAYSNNVNVGTGKVTVTGKGYYTGTLEKTFRIEEAPKINIASAEVILSKDTYTYDGTAKRPAVTVRLNGNLLLQDRDYSAAYSNNVNVGTGKVTVTGKGGYTGTAEKTFRIQEPPKISIASAEVILSKDTYTYDGTAKRPAVTVRLNGNLLLQDRDYSVGYSSNVNVGTGKVTVTGKGSYTGSVEKTFRIQEPPKIDIASATVALSQDTYTYDGAAKRPAVTVRLNGTALLADRDYSVTYSNNVNVGTAKVTVTGKGGYIGSVEKTFQIQEPPKISIASATVALSQDTYTYDGKAKEPTVTVKLNGTTLKKDTDYSVAYSDNIKVGTAKVTVTGKGGYTGSAEKTFQIQEPPKISIASATVTLSQDTYTYDGKAKKPTVTVKLGGTTLKKDTDYSVAYSNNTNVGTAKVTVTGKGSYTGTVTRNFSIVKKSTSFAWGKDNWNFNNSSYQGYFSSGKYIDQINSTYRKKLKDSLTNTEYKWIFDKNMGWLYDNFKGSCYGMSSTALLAKSGYLPYADYKSKATALYQLNYPKGDKKVSSLVTYYQMLQVKEVIQQQYRTVPSKSHKENIQKIISLLDSNKTVLVGFKKDGWGGHAILAYGYEYGSFTWNGVSYQGHILICDPNSSKSYNRQCDIYFNTKTYNWAIPYYFSAPITSAAGAKFNYIGANINEINKGGYLSGTANTGSLDFVARIDAEAISGDRSVVKMRETNGSYFPNYGAEDDIVEDYSYVLGGESQGTIGYNLYDAESSYKVSQENPEKLQLSMDYGNCYLEGGSMAGDHVIFDKRGYVAVAGESADFNISMTFNEDYPTEWFTMMVSGAGADEVSLEKTDEGYILEGDNLEEIEVEASNREVSAHTSFSTEYPAVYIYESDEGTLGVKADTDNNGTYETMIAEGNKVWPEPEIPVSIENGEISGIKSSYTYTGKDLRPVPVLELEGQILEKGTEYTVSYKNNKNVGTATVTIQGQGSFTGTRRITFKINPKRTSITKLTKGPKRITVKWKKQASQVSGYEIQCSTSSKFKNGTIKKTMVKKTSQTSVTVKKLKARKKYFVRIRTYKTVSGRTYYSGWSAAGKVTTK